MNYIDLTTEPHGVESLAKIVEGGQYPHIIVHEFHTAIDTESTHNSVEGWKDFIEVSREYYDAFLQPFSVDDFPASIDIAMKASDEWFVCRGGCANYYLGSGPGDLLKLRKACHQTGVKICYHDSTIEEWLSEKFTEKEKTNNGISILETRMTFLQCLYDKVGGSTRKIGDIADVGNEVGLNEEETSNFADTLHDQGLLRIIHKDGGVQLTAKGVDHIEDHNQQRQGSQEDSLNKMISENEQIGASLKRKLQNLVELYKDEDERISSEVKSVMALIEIQQLTKAAFTLAKIVENLLKEKYISDEEFKTHLTSTKGKKRKPSFHEFLEFAKSKDEISRDEYHFAKGLKEIRNEEGHEIGVRKDQSFMQTALFIGVGLILRLRSNASSN